MQSFLHQIGLQAFRYKPHYRLLSVLICSKKPLNRSLRSSSIFYWCFVFAFVTIYITIYLNGDNGTGVSPLFDYGESKEKWLIYKPGSYIYIYIIYCRISSLKPVVGADIFMNSSNFLLYLFPFSWPTPTIKYFPVLITIDLVCSTICIQAHIYIYVKWRRQINCYDDVSINLSP